mgnify:CR=1 FL=1
MLARRDDARTERTRAMEPTTRRGALETRSGGAYSPERPQTTKAREKENVAMMAAHATCTMNGSPSATWPTASTTAADAGAADTICAATLAAAALSATYAFKRDVALSSVSRAHRARHGASHAPFPSIPNLGATAIEAPRLASRRRLGHARVRKRRRAALSLSELRRHQRRHRRGLRARGRFDDALSLIHI